MTWQTAGAAALLVIGVGIELLCCIGLVVMPTVYDRLHYLGPATVLGPVIVVAAVVLQEALSSAGIMAMLTAGVLVFTSPVLTHATARAARTRWHGRWEPQPDEQIEEC